MLVVDRDDFIAWTRGILLERSREGACLVGDKKIHQQAKEALDDGETVGLTRAGRIVTHLRLVGDRYQELELED
jgi:hypothetical protein